ncbi:hypothetical protein [Aquabacterium sp. J223]|uniref:hypothetical protein n=1 Tax=Aquabacterium sp. J223 TaxID=2898431 RepID=UPI0021AD80E1|nr:hypothetical protein [Aquabacterium sp. J223]UUX94717.1 hypothetical protein LRS07_15715 [Aquabacterium sp. J223]
MLNPAPDPAAAPTPAAQEHVLIYASLSGGPAMRVPCNDHGMVDLDGLGEQGRVRYLLARALIGREYDLPVHVGPDEAGHCGPGAGINRVPRPAP